MTDEVKAKYEVKTSRHVEVIRKEMLTSDNWDHPTFGAIRDRSGRG